MASVGMQRACALVLLFFARQAVCQADLPGPFLTGIVGTYAGPRDVDPNTPPGTPIVGACGYGELRRSEWPYFAAAAISRNSSAFTAPGPPEDGCGRCIEIRCTDAALCAGRPSLQTLVTDTCNSCPANRINIPYPVFIANLTGQAGANVGTVPVQYRQVRCTPPGNIAVQLVRARPNLGGFLQLALKQVAGIGALQGVGIRSSANDQGLFSPLDNSYGAVWQANQLPGSPPFDLQITGGAGDSLIARNAIPNLTPGTYPTHVQFGGNAPAPAPGPAATPAAEPAATPATGPAAETAGTPAPLLG